MVIRIMEERKEGEWLGHVEQCDMRHMYRFIVMNNQLSFQGRICICIPSYRHNDIPIAITDD